MQLRQAEALGVLDHHDGRLRHVDADLDHRGGDQELRLARREALHGAVLVGALHAAVHEIGRGRRNVALQIGEALLGGGKVGLLGFLDQRAHPIDLPAFGERAADRVDHLVEPRRAAIVRVSIGWRPAGFSRSSETSMSPK